MGSEMCIRDSWWDVQPRLTGRDVSHDEDGVPYRNDLAVEDDIDVLKAMLAQVLEEFSKAPAIDNKQGGDEAVLKSDPRERD